MKFSIATSFLGVKFKPVAIIDDIELYLKKISSLGYDAIEVTVKDTAQINIDRLRHLLSKYNLSISCFGTGLIFFEDGLSISDKDKKNSAISRIKKHIETAKEFSSFVVIGLVRGKYLDNKKIALRNFKNSMNKIMEFAEKERVKILLEPINRYETDLINNVDSALSFISEIKSKNLGILFDTFHSNIEEKDICQSILKCKEYLWHIHLADSNRYAPSLGHINFKEILRTLNKIKYSGYYSFEILPYPTQDKSAELSIEYLKKINSEIKIKKYKNPALTVDVIVETDEGVVLIKRKNEPFKNMWALPGGFVDYNEKVEDAAVREIKEEVGIDIKLIKLLGVYSRPDRDPRGHTVSCVYVAKKTKGDFFASDDAKEIKITHDFNFLNLAFDHNEILNDYYKKYRRKK